MPRPLFCLFVLLFVPEVTHPMPDFDSLWDYTQPADTETRFRALLPEVEDNPSAHAQLLTQIARAQGLQGKSQEAHATLDEAEGIIAGIADDPARAVAHVRLLLERGRAHNGTPRPYDANDERATRARPFFMQAWEAARAAGEDGYAVDAAHMLAIVASPDSAQTWNYRALAVAEQSQQPHARRWLGSLHNNIGWTHFDLAEYPQALDQFERALSVRRRQGDETAIRIARWSVAKALRFLDRTTEALSIQRALLQAYQDDGESDAYVFEEMAECLLAMGQPQQAKQYFGLAYQALSRDAWFVDNQPDRLERLRELSREE